MTTLRSNFRGARACLVLPQDTGCALLVRSLSRLGLDPLVMSPNDAAQSCEPFDIAFVDADQDFEPIPQDIPHIALIGIEAPSRVARVVRANAAAVLAKPLRVAGIFSAVYIAFNSHALRQQEAQERAVLQRRAEGRRPLIKAILKLMQADGIDDEEAYRRLRMQAMRRRIPIEIHAAELLAEDPNTPAPDGNSFRRIAKP